MAPPPSKQAKNRRILKEIEEMRDDPPPNCSAGPASTDNVDYWIATIIGPPGTPYDGELFELEIRLPPLYPFEAPKFTMLTEIFHCNIKSGLICLDILKNEWSPALTIGRVLLSISSLLADPNPDDPLNSEAANLYKTDRNEYNKRVRDIVNKNSRRHCFDDKMRHKR